LNQRQLDIAQVLREGPTGSSGALVRIGYFSGTRTHQRDFACCEQALMTIMSQRPEIVLRIGGYLDLGQQWQRFAERIERVGFLEPDALLRSIAECDVNLAPLELGNPFCEAKSELKFFEAAVVRVPTIASATEPFAAVIGNGVDGFVVRDDTEWRRALEFLATSATARRAIGEAARCTALRRFSSAAVIPQAISALGLRAPSTRQSLEDRVDVRAPAGSAAGATEPQADKPA
ncbi:MAG TPA: glycosyltransferase, partial [Stellaceae bacterium]|nr:glycosyltransferase [Stellaceae bacterium]